MARMISRLTCLWNIKATFLMIKRKHTKHYNIKMCSSKVEYSTYIRPYCTTHDAKVPFCMLYFSSSKITSQIFHVDKVNQA